jgi:hypothetical protein
MSDARLFPEDLVARKFQQRSHILHRQRLEKISATPTDRIDNRSLSSTARPVRRNYNKLGRHYIVTEVRILEENKKLVDRITEIALSNTVNFSLETISILHGSKSRKNYLQD